MLALHDPCPEFNASLHECWSIAKSRQLSLGHTNTNCSPESQRQLLQQPFNQTIATLTATAADNLSLVVPDAWQLLASCTSSICRSSSSTSKQLLDGHSMAPSWPHHGLQPQMEKHAPHVPTEDCCQTNIAGHCLQQLLQATVGRHC